ncbi:hypothetical protein BGZ52_009853 [Haplosporangium bisporale]|nr:hypothetical protein BGZ52_009853 [Haplosporangium bisporale]
MWVHDQRDEPLMPSTGHFIRVIQEYAGLGGDVEHLRQEVEAQIARSNDKGYIVSASVKSGYLHSLNGKPSKISDRFFLGGPMSVRGFKSNDDLTKTPSVSAGAGIVYRHPQVRIELNFALPLMAAKTDAVSRGWQLGLGISFL